MIDVAGEFGAKVYFGDGTRLDLLRQAGAAEAELILFCLDGEQLDAGLLRGGARGLSAGGDVRSRLRPADADGAARCAGRLRRPRGDRNRRCRWPAPRWSGSAIREEDIDRVESFYRANDRERLDMQKEHGDIRAGRERTIASQHTWAEAGSEI